MNCGKQRRTRVLASLATGPATLKALAAEFGTSDGTMHDILCGLDAEGLVVSVPCRSAHNRPSVEWRLAACPSKDHSKQRNCLTCGDEFLSQHAGVRMCTRCRATAQRDPLTPYDFSPC